MLTEKDVKQIFDNKESKMNRVIVTQQRNNYCISLVREKLILRYPIAEAFLIVRDEIYHKIKADKPNLIEEALSELKDVKDHMASIDAHFFAFKPISSIIPKYMMLLQYLGLNSKKSKLCCRIKNYSDICKSFVNKNLNEKKLSEETVLQLDSLNRRLNFYLSCEDTQDVIIYILRYDINKK